MKRSKWFEVLLVVAVMAISAYAAFSEAHNFPNNWFTRDDAYYYFKVAQNISEGRGVTFDGVNRANGFHPLWMLVCIPIFALARFDLILPLRLLLLVMAALNAATGVLLYRLLTKVLSAPVGMLAAAFWVFNLYVHATVVQLGLESGITAFAIVLLLYLLESFETKWRARPVTLKQILGLAAAAALVLFSRLDTIFLVTLIGLWLIFRAAPIRYYLPLDVLTIAVIGFVSFALRFGFPLYYQQYSDMAVWMTAIALMVKIPIYYFSGLYQRPAAWSIAQLLKRIGLAVSGASAVLAVIMLALPRAGLLGGFPRSVLLMDWGFTLLVVGATRLGAYQFHVEKSAKAPLSPRKQIKENWKRWVSEALAYYGILGGALGIYALWNLRAFGTPSPVSGQIKRWWGTLPDRVYGGPAPSLYAFLGIDPEAGVEFGAWEFVTTIVRALDSAFHRWFGGVDNDIRYLTWFALLVAAFLVILSINRRRAIHAGFRLTLLPLLAGSGLQILYYNGIGYASSKEWYWVSEMLFVILLYSLLADILLQQLRRWPLARRLILAATLVICFEMAANFGAAIPRLMPYTTAQADQPYMDILPFLEENTEPGALIGMTGGGNVGYFISDRTIVNMDGLINSNDYFRALQSGQGEAYLEQMGLDYVFANPDILSRAPYRFKSFDNFPILAFYGRKALMRFLPSNAMTP